MPKPKIDNTLALNTLGAAYDTALSLFIGGDKSPIGKLGTPLQKAFEEVFTSKTRSYREVLLDCAVAKICSPSADVRFIYSKQSESAFVARSLNPATNAFLKDHHIPSTASPYLAAFKSNGSITPGDRDRFRDKVGFDALCGIVDAINKSTDLTNILVCIMYELIAIREETNIELRPSPKITAVALPVFLDRLLGIKSGGKIPMLMAEAFFRTMNDFYNYGWTISVQGINEPDIASKALGDITIVKKGGCKIGIEITERPIDSDRVRGTYEGKISKDPDAKDYIFVHTKKAPTDSARRLADIYSQQGCNISFFDLTDFIMSPLILGGSTIVTEFLNELRDLISHDASVNIKAAWNETAEKISEHSLS